MKHIDVIIPVRNEAENIKPLMERLDKTLKESNISYNAIIVDDNSKDNTIEEIVGLKKTYPVILLRKQGKPGKAYSILEGAAASQAEFLVMIDGDLQYPPEAIPGMLSIAHAHGAVVANRVKHNTGKVRKLLSKLNTFIFSRALLGFKCDAQSGLKLFRREVIEHILPKDVSPWTLDMPLLYTALELGYSIGCVDIEFYERKKGQSKVSLIKTAPEIAFRALKLRFLRRKRTYIIRPSAKDSMVGSGVVHARKRFVTHTNLSHDKSALVTATFWQAFILAFLTTSLITGLVISPLPTGVLFIGILSVIYFADVVFNLYLTGKSINNPPEIKASDNEISDIKDKDLPIYSVLCPLYKEAHILPQFLDSIRTLDWPKKKLDVILLLEEDDTVTIEAANKLEMPEFVRVLVVPHSQPKTKPKACNYGLNFAKGEYVVIYDAEDQPEPAQLKKAYLAFRQQPDKVICLQAKLNYYNPHQNLLTRLFTAEYSLWFDIVLPGLQSINTTIPLGGTSNHFRIKDLIKLGAWDPFNVTEDCDLGVRLFKSGYKTAIIDSVTLEEANSSIRNWIRQRSRWIKGYLQTFLVHNRKPWEFARRQGVHALIFQLVIGLRISFMLINPILWLATISYFAAYSIVGPAIEKLYPGPILYIAVISLVFGNFMYLYNYMIAVAKRGQWNLVKFVFLVPLYWLMVSWAALVAFVQLVTKPHYWEKTHHGLHLNVKTKTATSDSLIKQPKTAGKFFSSHLTQSGLLVAAAMVANVFNFLYNAYLGRKIGFEEFGLISLIGSFLSLSQIPLSSLSRTITHRAAFIYGKTGHPAKSFWAKMREKILTPSILLSGIWMISIPLLLAYFNSERVLPFLMLTPIWFMGIAASVDSGFLSGSLMFGVVAVMTVLEVATKFFVTVALVRLNLESLIYVAIPISEIVPFLIGWAAALKVKSSRVNLEKEYHKLPKKFLASTALTKVASIAFVNLDLIFVKHYLPPREAGQYALLSTVGKIVYFLGSLFSQFVVPFVSKNEGAGKNSKHVFISIVLLTALTSGIAFVGVGVFGFITVPILFGAKSHDIIKYLPSYALSMACLSVGNAIVSYHQSKHKHILAVGSFSISILMIAGIVLNHYSVGAVSDVLSISGVLFLIAALFLHLTEPQISRIANQIRVTITRLFSKKGAENVHGLKILVFNWRDTKHAWAGGAEVYLHEIAKEWTKNGNKVTIFCGNDQKNPRHDKIDGIDIVRRGGFYTVYVWGFIYYLLYFRGKHDVVIDSQNGVPFFTPFYVKEPKVLLIHHVHQEVFRKHLPLPLSTIARFIEGTLMPWVYKNQKIITVSSSSKGEIINLGLGEDKTVEVVPPGVNVPKNVHVKKTSHPSFIYLGRIKPYKNIDVAIKAFALFAKENPSARLTIAGEGESSSDLRQLAQGLSLGDKVNFVGRVSDSKKYELLAAHWVAIQPSSIEGWGITVIEANGCGTPVIASDVNGLKDSVLDGKTGVLVEAQKPVLLARAMTSLVTDLDLLWKLSSNAKVWSHSFSWEEAAEKFINILVNVSPFQKSKLNSFTFIKAR